MGPHFGFFYFFQNSIDLPLHGINRLFLSCIKCFSERQIICSNSIKENILQQDSTGF